MGYTGYHENLDAEQEEQEAMSSMDMAAESLNNARRYQKLREIGVAPAATLHLRNGHVLVGSNLDLWIDYLLTNGHPVAPAETTEYPQGPKVGSKAWDRQLDEIASEGKNLAFTAAIRFIEDLHNDVFGFKDGGTPDIYKQYDPRELNVFSRQIQAAIQRLKEHVENAEYPSAMQTWTRNIPVMQQSVLMSAIRGMDGLPKLHPAKALIKFFRRSILISAFDKKAINDPFSPGGGDFTGPSFLVENFDSSDIDNPPEGDVILGRDGQWIPVHQWFDAMPRRVDDFLRARDEMGMHYYWHAANAFHILAVHHPVPVIAAVWRTVFVRMVEATHQTPETDEAMNRRLSDDPEAWKARSDEAGSCST